MVRVRASRLRRGVPSWLLLAAGLLLSMSDRAQATPWVSFAVTYDGTLHENNVNFYIGTESSAVTLVPFLKGKKPTLDKGPTEDNNSGLTIGNKTSFNTYNNRPFDGFLDNMRIYGSHSGNSGVLTLSQLKSIRDSDVNDVNPPANPNLILQYSFNECSGTTAASTGSDTTALTLRSSAGSPTNLFSADGLGVSGKSGDCAFDNTASTGMGSVGIGGRADQADLDAIDNLMSFTLAGWFKTDGTTLIGNNARLFENWNDPRGFFLYGYNSNGSGLNFTVDGANITPYNQVYGVTSTSEPATLFLLGSGLAGLGGTAWRRHRRN
jgi:hypothetical protein